MDVCWECAGVELDYSPRSSRGNSVTILQHGSGGGVGGGS